MTELYRKCGECKGEGFTFKDTTFQGAKFQTARKCPANCTRGFVPVEAVEVHAMRLGDGIVASDIKSGRVKVGALPASLVIHSEAGK